MAWRETWTTPPEDANVYQNGNTKTVTVSIPGTGKVHQAEVGPDTTTGEVLRRMGLDPAQFDAAAPDGSRLLKADDKPYELVRGPEDAIAVTPTAAVG